MRAPTGAPVVYTGVPILERHDPLPLLERQRCEEVRTHKGEETDADRDRDRHPEPPTIVRAGYLIGIRAPILTSIQDKPMFISSGPGVDIAAPPRASHRCRRRAIVYVTRRANAGVRRLAH